MSHDANRLTRGVVRVGDGRGFVVRCQSYQGLEDLIVITAAHCLPHFPPCHPAMYLEEKTYQRLLGPLGSEPMVWAECLFADPIADIAVLGSPDDQALYDKAEFYRQLVASAYPFTIADAPAQGRELVGTLQIECPTPGEGIAFVPSRLTLSGTSCATTTVAPHRRPQRLSRAWWIGWSGSSDSDMTETLKVCNGGPTEYSSRAALVAAVSGAGCSLFFHP
jgi:hypothetical protein